MFYVSLLRCQCTTVYLSWTYRLAEHLCSKTVGHFTFWISLSLSVSLSLIRTETKDQPKCEVFFFVWTERFAELEQRTWTWTWKITGWRSKCFKRPSSSTCIVIVWSSWQFWLRLREMVTCSRCRRLFGWRRISEHSVDFDIFVICKDVRRWSKIAPRTVRLVRGKLHMHVIPREKQRSL